MFLTIFGAGASYDSSPLMPLPSYPTDDVDTPRLPLANGLFTQRHAYREALKQFPHAMTLIDAIRRATTTDPEASVERILADLRDQAAVYPRRLSQLLAIRYYIHAIIRTCEGAWLEQTCGSTNYVTLLNRLRFWSVSTGTPLRFVTFNYDTLLEHAWEQHLPTQLGAIGDYVTDPQLRVFKLHGSTSWYHRMNESLQTSSNPYDQLLTVEGPLPILPSYEFIRKPSHPIKKWPFVPAIALPYDVKTEFECPPDHVTVLEDDLPAVKKVLIIGWRATEEQFLKRWAEHGRADVSVLVVSQDRGHANSVLVTLKENGIRGELHSSPSNGFDAFMRGDELERFRGS